MKLIDLNARRTVAAAQRRPRRKLKCAVRQLLGAIKATESEMKVIVADPMPVVLRRTLNSVLMLHLRRIERPLAAVPGHLCTVNAILFWAHRDALPLPGCPPHFFNHLYESVFLLGDYSRLDENGPAASAKVTASRPR